MAASSCDCQLCLKGDTYVEQSAEHVFWCIKHCYVPFLHVITTDRKDVIEMEPVFPRFYCRCTINWYKCRECHRVKDDPHNKISGAINSLIRECPRNLRKITNCIKRNSKNVTDDMWERIRARVGPFQFYFLAAMFDRADLMGENLISTADRPWDISRYLNLSTPCVAIYACEYWKVRHRTHMDDVRIAVEILDNAVEKHKTMGNLEIAQLISNQPYRLEAQFLKLCFSQVKDQEKKEVLDEINELRSQVRDFVIPHAIAASKVHGRRNAYKLLTNQLDEYKV